MSKPENGPFIPAMRWPVPKNNRGREFSNQEEMLAHLEGEATGHWLLVKIMRSYDFYEYD